jgi:hypothetical protein
VSFYVNMRDVTGREEEETKVYVPTYSEWIVGEERDRAVNSDDL